jgi:hypothetical protein
MSLTLRQFKKWLIGLAILSIITILVSGCVASHTPVITSFQVKPEVVPCGCYEFECIASDPDGGELKYEWQVSGGDISGSETPEVTWVAPEELGEYTISATVTDEDGNVAVSSSTITVRENHPPEIILTACAEWVVPSASCTIECVASDPDGDNLSYEWLASGGDISGEGSSVTWSAPDVLGTYNIIILVKDDLGSEATTMVTIDVVVNHPPAINSLVAQYPKLKPASTTAITCTAQDPDGDELSYAWTASRGGISAEGSVAIWVAPNCDGSYNITVVVRDGRGGEAEQSVQVEVGCG